MVEVDRGKGGGGRVWGWGRIRDGTRPQSPWCWYEEGSGSAPFKPNKQLIKIIIRCHPPLPPIPLLLDSTLFPLQVTHLLSPTSHLNMRPQSEDSHSPNQSQQNLVIHANAKPITLNRATTQRQRKEEITLENYDKTHLQALERVDPKGIQAHTIIVSFSGSVRMAELYEGTEDLQVSFEIKWGEEWREDTRSTKKQSRQSQYCEAKEGIIVFDLTFEGTLSCPGTPNSWPQLILVFKGFDVFGHKIVKGYAQMHFPISPGQSQSVCHIYTPQPQSGLFHRFRAWLTGTSMEYKKDYEKIIIKGEGRQVGKVRSIGAVMVDFNLLLRNFGNFGFS